jgi:hypothetical protein
MERMNRQQYLDFFKESKEEYFRSCNITQLMTMARWSGIKGRTKMSFDSLVRFLIKDRLKTDFESSWQEYESTLNMMEEQYGRENIG